MNKKILAAAAAAAAVLILTRKEDKKPYTPNSADVPIVVLPPAPPDREVTSGSDGGNAPINNLGVAGFDENTPPKLFWVYLYNQILSQNNLDIELTMKDLWNVWNVEQNHFRSLYPTKTALFLALSSYVPERSENGGISNPPMINWDSVPVYDTLSNWWAGVTAWTCSEWKIWHIELEKHYQDTYKANNAWLVAWNDNENQCATLYLRCPLTSFCNLECDFVEYLYSKDIDVSNLFSTAYCSLTNITKNIIKAGSSVVNAGANVVHTVSNITEGVKNTSSTLSFVLPAAAAVLVINYLSKNNK